MAAKQKPPYESIRVIASAEGTSIIDANRKAIQNIFGINIALRAGKPPVMQINMIAGAFDVDGKPMFMAADPAGGPPKPVKKIEWWDGTGLDFPEPPAVNVVMQPPAGGTQTADPAGVKAITPVAPPQDNETPPAKLNGGAKS